MKMYRELAPWWPLLSAPEDYAEEAGVYLDEMRRVCAPLDSVLELGSGGGNNASHLKHHVRMTLVDRSPEMLDVSRTLNPDLEHVEGDMRNVRLDRTFDAVFIHDAIGYITSEDDLARTIATALAHCRPGGLVLCVPDFITETFHPYTSHGGHDDGARGLRYLEWVWDPDPHDTTYSCEFAFLLRDRDGSARCESDHHVCGLFPRATWLRLLHDGGLAPSERSYSVTDMQQDQGIIFIGARPRAHGDDD